MADNTPVNPAMSKFLSRARPDKQRAQYVQDVATQASGYDSYATSPEQRVAANLMHLMKPGQHGGDTIYLPPTQEEPHRPVGTDRKERSKEFKGNALYNSSIAANPRLYVDPAFPGVDKNGFEKMHDDSPRSALGKTVADQAEALSVLSPQLKMLLGGLDTETARGYAPKRKPLTPYKSPKLPPGKGPGPGGRKETLDHEPWHPIPPAPGATPVKPKPDQRTTFTG